MKYTDPSGKQFAHATDSGYGYAFDVQDTNGDSHTGGFQTNWFQDAARAREFDRITTRSSGSSGPPEGEVSSTWEASWRVDAKGGQVGNAALPPRTTSKGTQLPSYSSLKAAFPALSVSDVGDLIGGKVDQNIDMGSQNGFENACAIWVSRALNYSGVKIPYTKGETSSGADHNWYFYRVKALAQFLLMTFGPPTRSPSTASDLAGVRGIILFDTASTWSNATGHFDLWNGSGCEYHCYWTQARSVSFWSAP